MQSLIEAGGKRNDRRRLRLLGVDELLCERSNPYFMIGDDEARWAEWIEEDRAAVKVSD